MTVDAALGPGADVLVPFLLEGVGGVAELNQPDQIHPTAAGQARVAANVWIALRGVLEAQAHRAAEAACN